MLHFRKAFLLGLLLLLAAGPVRAQLESFSGFGAEEENEKITWQVQADRNTVRPGEQVRITWRAELAPGWHLYAMDSPEGAGVPLSISVDSLPEGWQQVGAFRQGTAKTQYDPFFKQDVRFFEESATVATLLEVQESVKAGKHTLHTSLTHQICDDKMCLPPTTERLTLPVTVERGSPRAAYAEMSLDNLEQVTPAASSASSGNAGLWSFLLLAIGAGFAALLTPCVFPMIPLTVSFFTKQGAGSRGQATWLALVYGLAIIVTFTGLGILTALLVGAAGAQTIAANPWVNLFIGGVFVVFALALLGLFELRLPSGLVNYFNRQSSERTGYVGVLFMGFTLTLVSFSCTAPFVGGLLAAAAQNQWAYPVLGMAGFSTAFSLPFVFFALFPNWLQSLPSSGGWMNVVKVVLGFVELAAAFKFISNADLVWNWGFFSRPLVLAIWIVIFALTGLYLLGKLSLTEKASGEPIGTLRLVLAIGFFSFALYLVPGLLGAPLERVDAYLPPREPGKAMLMSSAGKEGTNTDALNWYEEVDAAMAAAKEANKPVFIDFTGYTCTNCREMEATVFPKPPVASQLANSFVLLRLYTDDAAKGRTWQKFQLELTGTVALPTYAIVSPDRTLLSEWNGMASVEEFATFLKQGAQQFTGKVAPVAVHDQPSMD